jgi:hypothetical protein
VSVNASCEGGSQEKLLAEPRLKKIMNLMTLNDEEVVAEQHDVEIMRRMHLWPYGSFLPLKHREAVDMHGMSKKAILYYSNSDPRQKRLYIFLPEVNIYSIPPAFWADSSRYRTGGETLLFEIISEGWMVR